MQPGMGFHRYTGTAPFGPWRGMASPGRCRQCGQPSASCCCGCRECRKEAKELLVTPGAARAASDTVANAGTAADVTSMLRSFNINTTAEKNPVAGQGTAFIGGRCCVTLAVEYAPSVATAAFTVLVAVKDSEGTVLIWARSEPAGTGYRVHECIISTNPGATLTVAVSNCTVQARWCEVFSC